MKIIVCVKHVVDTTEVRVDKKSGELVLRNIPTKINDYDKHAIEEAVRLKEKQKDVDITLLCVGPKAASKTLKEALAMGADRAYLVSEPGEVADPVIVAQLLAKSIGKIGLPDLIFCGAVSEDGYNFQVGPSLAEWLGISHISYATHLEVKDREIVAERLLENESETVEADFPVVITVDRKINTPRLPTALQVMKVSLSKISNLSLADIGITESDVAAENSYVKVLGYEPFSQSKQTVILQGKADDLVSQLVGILGEKGVI
ncbi:electron transfer flavoprotein subunit beta [Paradesulfitobacterium aromaticivorans]